MVFNQLRFEIFNGEGDQTFLVNNFAGTSKIRSAILTISQDRLNFTNGTWTGFANTVFMHTVTTDNLGIYTNDSTKKIIFGIGGQVEKHIITNTQNQSLIPFFINSGGLNTVDASAILQADSTTQGFLPPRMTTTQRDNIATPAEGLVIYNTTLQRLDFYNGTTWGAV
jgi:hypothetical protein